MIPFLEQVLIAIRINQDQSNDPSSISTSGILIFFITPYHWIIITFIRNNVDAILTMYANSKLPTIAEARQDYWKCSKCKETFDNYRELRDHKNNTHGY